MHSAKRPAGKIAGKIHDAFEAKGGGAEESLRLKQRLYSVQGKLIELRLW
jgi:hypothetical protein